MTSRHIHYLLVVGCIAGVRSATQCMLRTGTNCICDMEDGTGDYIDLTAVSNNDGPNVKPFFTNIKNGRYTYDYNPCTLFEENKCKDAAVCQTANAACGRMTDVTFDTTVNPPTLTYGGGDDLEKNPRVSIVKLVCDSGTDHKLTADGEHPGGHYRFTLTSSHACVQKPKPPPSTTKKPTQPAPAVPTTSPRRQPNKRHVSLGTIMDICLFMALLVYVSVGFAFMYVKRGVRGREALPNYEFWIGLPGLIKEGCMFIVTKARNLRGSRSGYESV